MSMRTSGDVLLAAFFCLPGLFLRLLTLTAGPPSWLDCVTVPGTSRFGRRLAAVGSPRGEESTAGVCRRESDGVRRLAAAGVADVLRLAALTMPATASKTDSSVGSAGGTVDFRDTGRDGGGGVDSSVLGATELRDVLAACVRVAGVDVSGVEEVRVGTFSFSGILIVPALG